MAEQKYIQERAKQATRSRMAGVSATVSLHVALLLAFAYSGFTYLDPPPPEKEQILIEFEEPVMEKPKQVWNGTQPKAVEPKPKEPINLIQRSEAQHEGTKTNEAPEAKVDDFGDVETPNPEPEKPIDNRALFRTPKNKTEKDTLAMQTADKVSDALKAGHAQGNTKVGETQGEPNAKLAGRSINGTLPRPSYGVQAAGAPSMRNSVRDGKIEELSGVSTIADGIAVKEPGQNTFNFCSKYVDGIVTVTDDEVSSAILYAHSSTALIASIAAFKSPVCPIISGLE